MKLSIKALSLLLIIGTTAYAADTASILPPAKTTFVDQNGKPLTSGTVDFYIPNTTTRKATWQDAGETILNTNPVTLDSAGRALILGSGSYRQVVKDRSNNLIWDQVTSSSSSGGGGTTPTATGDGDLVGTIKPWAGLTAPNQYMFTYGQEISRTTYSVLFTAITSSQAVFCNSGDPVISGLADTTNFNIGVPVELSCVAGGFTSITAKTSTTVTLALTPNVTANVTAVFFPWGNGNHTTTFNLPDYRGIVPIGNNNMGGVASANMISTYFGTNPNSIGGVGGAQSTTLITSNFPPYTPAGIITNGAITSTFTGLSGQTGLTGAGGAQAYTAGGFASSQIIGSVASSQAVSTFAGGAQGGTSTPFSRVQPSQTTNFIVKVTPDVNSATASGVTSLGGMTGSIACGAGLLCTGNTISVTITDQVSGPASSVIGNFAFWTDTLGRSIGATPAFIVANPANASIYSQLSNPIAGSTGVYNGIQFSVGTPIPASGQYPIPLGFLLQQAIVGSISIPVGDTLTGQASALAGYSETNVATGGAGANPVGVYAQGTMGVPNASVFSWNSVSRNTKAVTPTVGMDANQVVGAEIDLEIWQKVGNINPTITNGVYGFIAAGGGNLTVTPSTSTGYFLNELSVATHVPWLDGFKTFTGAAVKAFIAGPLHSGNNQPSQSYNAQYTNGAGTVVNIPFSFLDGSGSLYFDPAPNSQINLRDGNGVNLLSSGLGFGGSGVVIPALSTSGVATNTSAGLIGTLAGTTTTVLHGNAAGLPTFNAVSLTADVSGSLPAVNGGTGQTAYVLGDTLYSPSANILFRLPGNTTSAKQYLSQTGTGAVSAAPAWATIAGADITGAALTKVDDTNVTLTLGGTPTTALLRASSLTLGWSGTLAVSRGGTGIASGTSGGIPYFSGTTSIASSALLTANAIMLGGGAGTAPATLGSLGTTTTILHGNAAGAPTFGAVVSADMNITATSCTNQFVTAISTGGVGTCTTDTLASAQHANQGTTTTVLHGNAAGNPSFAAVSLTVDVSGILPIANGGTGNSSGTATINANLTGPITSTGNATSIASQTGTGTKFVVDTSPTLVTPVLGAATATTINGVTLDNLAWTTYTPSTASSTVGATPATYTVNSARYKQIGKTIFVATVVTVTNQGIGAAGDILIGLPFTASSATAASWVGSSREYSLTGKSGFAWVTTSGTTMACRDATNTTYIATGNIITSSITYEVP